MHLLAVLLSVATATPADGAGAASTADHGELFLAALRFRHRAALGRPKVTLDELAAEAGVQPRALAAIWSTLARREAVGPIAALQAIWRRLPAPTGPSAERARGGCALMNDLVAALRARAGAACEPSALATPTRRSNAQGTVSAALSLPGRAREAVHLAAAFVRFCSLFPVAQAPAPPASVRSSSAAATSIATASRSSTVVLERARR